MDRCELAEAIFVARAAQDHKFDEAVAADFAEKAFALADVFCACACAHQEKAKKNPAHVPAKK